MEIILIWNSELLGEVKKKICIDQRELNFEELKILYEETLKVPWNEDSDFKIFA